LRLGSVPLWDPSLTVGHSAQVLLPYLGATHPIWLLTFFLTLIGAPFYFSFVATIIFYFLLGVAGFYFLSKAVLRDDEAAYLAFLLFLFSSFNFVLFAQYHPVIITVPGMWFFSSSFVSVKRDRPETLSVLFSSRSWRSRTTCRFIF